MLPLQRKKVAMAFPKWPTVTLNLWTLLVSSSLLCFVVYQLAVQKFKVELYEMGRQQRIHELIQQSAPIDASVIEELYQAISSERLARIANKFKEVYSLNDPFPHITIDGIFPKRFLEEVLKENHESVGANGCLAGAGKCFQERVQKKKSAIEEDDLMGLHTKILFSAMKSSNFIHFLEMLTGIQDIIPDPHYRGSGIHLTATGGNLNVHADFNKYEAYQLDRRVNSFVFLNQDWPESYGGHLEFWTKDMGSCVQRILPVFGRFVVFSSTDFSYHGHPQPLSTPEGRARRSLALYYYTNGRPANECLKGDCSGRGHSTLFQRPVGCKICEEQTCKAYRDNEKLPYWEDSEANT
ncbi:predicted protein [Phaeodactylum tricornutum CCAP 1055/1]|jgi:Rps23 Pro-64 3,4-dihydroxylase Tpa1-like proline 4-hydroxylase|uniref:Prolyl 4-hydroxylase alpha subunit Fe(2+) 2OG dioxygenase domain-containing protein n=1 Tax=Phaeodactylum tricornutum (strain CCAP 1055/1) TaxID=556484 RepID=B7FUE3_PHATC|nr:predicted protein [Phaeodactylum tricornutum CCAP 1055/1]EEC49972.1 predicted protein [Phaeodactylum tricornutum CCAP 1055/1]|eukprot:XP_002178307.1 predicted protein [Phaeodactylum tricornutum CCAP 1055/1]